MGFTVDAIVSIRELKRRYLAWVLERTGQNKSEAARQMGIDRASLSRMLRKRGAGSDEPGAALPAPGAGLPAGDGASGACHCTDYQSSGLPCPPGTCPNNPYGRPQ